jgi:pimeloyl-ACP methyl ester carboxylesterase
VVRTLFSTTHASRQVIVNDHLVRTVSVEPQGEVHKTIVFLHGWRSQAAVFDDVMTALDDGRTRMLAINLPGFGGSQAPKQPFRVEDYADIVAELLKKLELKGVAVVGHSFGGAVAARLATEYPELVSRLVLVGAAGIREATPSLTLKRRIARFVKPFFRPAFMQPLRRAIYRSMGAEDAVAAPQLAETFKLVVAQDMQSVLADITQPVLLVWGTRDTATPVEHGRKMAEHIPHAVLTVVDRAGHYVFLDQPKQFLEHVEAFLKG